MRLTMTGEFTYAQLKGAKWTDEQMVAAGHARPWQPSDEPPPAQGRGDTVTVMAQIQLFKGCVYVEDLHAVIVPGVDLPLDKKRFDVRFGGRKFLMDKANGTTTDSAWDCFTESKAIEFLQVDATYFDPRDPVGHTKLENGMMSMNTYTPLTIKMMPGDPSPFINHISKILPNGNDAQILTSYLAACVQYPGVKSMWAPLLQGAEGNGKSILVEAMARAIGRRHTHAARASEIDGKFNSYLFGKLFVAFNEVKVTQDKQSVWETLKSYVTDPWQQIEYKGGAIVQRELVFNILFASNYTDALPKTKDARRICPLFCAQQSEDDLIRDGMLDANRQTSVYFDALYHWLEKENGYSIVAHYLKHYTIPEDLNFAGRCKRAPLTTSTNAAISASLGGAEQEVIEAIEDGVNGFRGGWIASHKLNELMDKSSKGKFVARNMRRKMLKDLGYVKHPGLPDDGRCPMPLAAKPRPRLYIKLGHPTEIMRGMQVVEAYINAQARG